MSKYIDAEKLITKIENRQEYLGDHNFHSMADEYDWLLTIVQSLQQEQPEVDLEKFTEKIKTFQERYKYPEIVSIKGAMAFMARMFYQYPNAARQWYDSLPKATMDDARKEE